MRTIAHISDLHFGAHDPAVADALVAELDGRNRPVPSLVAISGDLTQRAKAGQFEAARAFLARLPGPYLLVPGNHDVPLYDVFTRLLDPLRRWRRAFGDDLMPTFVDDELVVVGINTAHGFTFKDGRVDGGQLDAACARLAAHPEGTHIVVAHHPFALPPDGKRDDLVDGAEAAIPRLEDAGVELLLTGHMHKTHLDDTSAYRSPDKAIVTVAAGTAISHRRRGENNSYNLIVVDPPELTIVHRIWQDGRFVDQASKTYQRTAGGRWRKTEVHVTGAA
jgi:3',5'-cyclic AMP phosphodiesterase CpdA